jgi:hypothetical protein
VEKSTDTLEREAQRNQSAAPTTQPSTTQPNPAQPTP